MPIKGDFISFSYNGVHSTDLGIVHVSSSDRYADALLPTIQDKTVQVPGNDGTYFFGSYYTQRSITLNIAFDNVSEDQIRLARRTFGDKKSHPLVFDEEPYKVYYAKVDGTPQYNYVPFNNYDEDKATRPRIYKGEGTITFICYEPFAHCPNQYKYLSQYTIGTPNTPSWYKYNNKAEWNYSAGLLTTQGTYDSFTGGSFKTYNPGDVEADFKFTVPINSGIVGIKITDGSNDLESYSLLLNTVTAKGNDTQLLFNSRTNLIEGLDAQGARTMNLYNEFIQSGHWFRIPMNETNKTWYFTPIFSAAYSGIANLEYDYLYF